MKDARPRLWIGLMLHRHSASDQKIFSSSWVDGSKMDYGDPATLKRGTLPWAPRNPNVEISSPDPENCVYIDSDVSNAENTFFN
jgi:hypothetical protein